MTRALAFLALLGLVACAPIQQSGPTDDPLESFNRQVFAFNEVVDTVLLRPVASTYRAITPEYARKGMRNFFRNFYEPVTMANALLQGDPERFFTSMWRFFLNTTLGFGGVYDFAGTYGNLPYRQEDFGQTLAVWADDDDSAYLVLPILGPSTTRDALGRVVDIFLDPWTYSLKAEEAIGAAVGQGITIREELIDPIDDVYATSFDPYATIRSAYEQSRKAAIHNRNDQSEAMDKNLVR